MPRHFVLPWFNRKELHHVYQELYSNDEVLQIHGLGRVAVWRCRCLRDMPVAIESTDSFISAVMEHKRLAQEGEVIQNDQHIRTLYSMALLRFVNHITEKGQTRAYALPIQKLAAKVRVPGWIVDLRHDATHGKLPSLTILSTAAKWCLDWLKREYWEKQIEMADVKQPKVEGYIDTLQDLLVSFQRLKFSEKDRSQEMKKTLDDLRGLISELKEASFPCLLEDGYLVPNEEQLTALHVNVESLKTPKKKPVLPNEVFTFWHPVFNMVSELGLVSDLLQHLVSELTEADSVRNELLYGWAIKCVQLSEFSKQPSTSQKMTIQQLCLVKHHHSVQLLRTLFKKMGPSVLTEERQTLLLQVLQSYFEQPVEKRKYQSRTRSDDEPIDTESTEEFSVAKILEKQQEEQTSHPWQTCRDVSNWSRIPIGILPGQTVTYRNLELSYTGGDSDVEEGEEQTRLGAGLGDSCDVIGADLSSIFNITTEEEDMVIEHSNTTSINSEGMIAAGRELTLELL